VGCGRVKLISGIIRTGQLRSFKIGKLRRIPVDAVHEFARRMLDEEGEVA
jgi:excisionase family DNA binding protein